MTFVGRFLLLITLLCAGLLPVAHADVAHAPGSDLQVFLVTYGPGEVYWERFGHDAIELRDKVSGEDVSFNYGVFDFEEKNFFLNFARGYMHYMIDAELAAPEQQSYIDDGRSVTRQQLSLSPEQAAALRGFLVWNLRPENAGYNYDYYRDNCTTRVRDALDKALGGLIKLKLSTEPGGMTYRQQTDRLMSGQAWLMLLMDLGLGPYADQPMDAWQASFLPEVLENNLRGLMISDGQNGQRQLVMNDELVAQNHLPAPPAKAPDLRGPLFCAGIVFALLLLVLKRYVPIGFAIGVDIYLLLAGVCGLVMLMLWTLTQHHSAWGNANLLLFNPLAWLLMRTPWRLRKQQALPAMNRHVIVLQLAMLLLACVMHLFPGTVQQNQPWLLLALPIWAAIAWELLRKPLR